MTIAAIRSGSEKTNEINQPEESKYCELANFLHSETVREDETVNRSEKKTRK